MATKIKKDLQNITKRVENLTNQNTQIIVNLEFTSDKEFYYIFNIFKQCKIVKTYKIFNDADFIKNVQMLENKYNTKIKIDFSNLDKKQLKYIASWR